MYFQRPVELNIDIELNSEQWGRGGTERMGKGRGGSAAGMREETHSFTWPCCCPTSVCYSARSMSVHL